MWAGGWEKGEEQKLTPFEADDRPISRAAAKKMQHGQCFGQPEREQGCGQNSPAAEAKHTRVSTHPSSSERAAKKKLWCVTHILQRRGQGPSPVEAPARGGSNHVKPTE
jgi:hypothetical protein